MSDLVISVRQISNYPATTVAGSGDNLLMQQGGPGAPYASINAADLVQTALQQAGPLGIGVIPPASGETQVFTNNFVVMPEGALLFNQYWTGTAAAAWQSGFCGGFALDLGTGTFEWDLGAGSAGQPAVLSGAMSLNQAGNLFLPRGTLAVARDPALAGEVATLGWVGRNTVGSFNNRNGQVILNASDVYNALKLCDPIATQPWVQQAITNSLQNLLYTCPFVNTWNGRKGSVYLMLSDISCVFMQPGQQPITQTPPPGSNDDSIANTNWVTSLVAQFDPGAQLSVINVLNHGARGDGVTDDTAAIQAVLGNYAGKAIILVPDTGRSFMVNPLVLSSGTRLIIDGTLRMRPNNTNSVLVLQNISNVTISGHGTLDGNGAAQTAICAGINAGNCSNLRIEGITIQNSGSVANGGWNLNVAASSNVVVDGVTMLGGQSANEFAAGCDNCWLMNCTIDGPNGDDGFAFYGGVTNSGAIGNTIRNAGGTTGNTGIFVLSDSGQPAVCRNILISNNIIYNSSGAGIAVDLAAPGLHEAVTITGNRVYDNNNIGQTGQSQIFIGGVTGCIVGDNMISAIDPVNNCAYGIRLRGCTGVTVTGNFIYNLGSVTEAGFGVWCDNPNIALVDGNTFHDYRPTSYMTAIGGSAGIANTFSNNLLGNLAAGLPITVTPQPDTIIVNGGSAEWRIQSGTLSVTSPVQYTNQNGIPRWYVGNQLNPESGGNSGSDFEIVSVNDAGTSLTGVPVVINRATGNVTFSGNISAANFLSVQAYGARGDGVTNDAAAIQAAANAAAGRTLYFPPATYLIGTPITLSSGTTVMAYGATIVPATNIASLPDSSNPALGSGLGPVMFTNVNWQATALTDHDIRWFGGTLGPLTGAARLACHALFFRMVTNVVIQDASARLLNDCFALLACANTVIERCYGEDYMNCAFDHWDGAMNATVRDCEARGGQSGLTTNGVLFNTDSTVTGHSSGVAANCTIDNVRVYNCDQAFSFGPLVAGPVCDDCTIINCYCTGGTYGIIYSGVTGGRIENNVIAANNANPLIIGVVGDAAHPSSQIVVTGNRFENCHPTGGAYIQALGPQMTIAHNKAANSTAYFAIWVDDPTTVVMPNYLPGYTIFLLNQTSQGGATTPAMELLADSTHNPGCTISTGSAVPSDTKPAGSIYLHAGGASGARLYVSAGGGTWNAVAGV